MAWFNKSNKQRKNKKPFSVCSHCQHAGVISWIWDFRLVNGAVTTCERCGSAWGDSQPRAAAEGTWQTAEAEKSEEDAGEEDKDVQPIELINESIFLNYFVVEGTKAKRKSLKQKEWDEMMTSATTKGREGDLVEAMRLIPQIKEDQEKFDAEVYDHVETEPFCQKATNSCAQSLTG